LAQNEASYIARFRDFFVEYPLHVANPSPLRLSSAAERNLFAPWKLQKMGGQVGQLLLSRYLAWFTDDADRIRPTRPTI
jgi:hypothetical protein